MLTIDASAKSARDWMKIKQIEDWAVLLALPIYRKQVIIWVKELSGLDGPLTIGLGQMPDSFRVLIQKAVLLSALVAVDDFRTEVDSQLSTKFSSPEEIPGFDVDMVGFDKAIEKLKDKAIAPPEWFKNMEAYSKSISFSVQRIESVAAIVKVKESLLRAIENGESLRDWKKKLNGIFNSYGVTPLKPHHIETVFRTNLLSVYNTANFEQALTDPNVEYMRAVGIKDARTTDICMQYIDPGVIYPANDPIWVKIRALRHYKCRCSEQPITRAFMERKGLRPTSEAPADSALELIDKDFTNKPISMAGYQDKLTRILDEKTRLSAELSNSIAKASKKS